MKLVPDMIFDEIVVNSLPGIFYVIDREGRFVQWNRNLEKATRYSAADISRKSLSDFFSPEDKELIAGKIIEGFKSGFTRVEASLVTKNGKQIPHIFTGTLSVVSGQKYLIGEALDIAELKMVQDLLAESERRLRTMLYNMPDGIIEIGDRCQILDVNRAGLAICGAKNREQVTGKTIAAFASAGFKKEVKTYCVAPFHDEKEIIEFECVGINGSPHWLEARATPFEPTSGGMLTKTLIIRDITDRKRRTLELAEANTFLKNIITSSPPGIIIYGSDGQCDTVSDSAGALVGASKEQLLTQNFRRIKSWKRSGMLEAAEDTLATGRINRKAVHLTTTFGKEIWIDYQFARFYSAGEPHLLLMFTDIEELIKTEKALAESEAKYRQLLEGANDAIFVADAETGILIDANKKATELIGKPLHKIIGMHQSKLHPEDEAENVSRIFKEQVSKGAGIAPEINVINGKGERIPVEVSTSVMDYKGRTIVQGIFRNISDRKQSEKAIFEKDRQIRRAYVDVLSAVTGGRLIIMDDSELSESLGNPLSRTYRISSYKSLSPARKNLNAIIKANKTAGDGYNEFVFAANEALANAVKHGVSGKYQVLRRNGIIQVLISDRGPGIDFSILPKATLVTGFSTKQSLGMGFSIMLDVCDKVLLSTQPGKTSLVLEKAIK